MALSGQPPDGSSPVGSKAANCGDGSNWPEAWEYCSCPQNSATQAARGSPSCSTPKATRSSASSPGAARFRRSLKLPWASGQLTLRVAKIYPPERPPDAHRRLEAGGTKGRLVIEF
jgi:hypothetical protein